MLLFPLSSMAAFLIEIFSCVFYYLWHFLFYMLVRLFVHYLFTAKELYTSQAGKQSVSHAYTFISIHFYNSPNSVTFSASEIESLSLSQSSSSSFTLFFLVEFCKRSTIMQNSLSKYCVWIAENERKKDCKQVCENKYIQHTYVRRLYSLVEIISGFAINDGLVDWLADLANKKIQNLFEMLEPMVVVFYVILQATQCSKWFHIFQYLNLSKKKINEKETYM